MGTPQQNQWMLEALQVAISTAAAISDSVADALPGGQNQAASATKGAPHVTVIDTPIIVHGGEPAPVTVIKKPVVIKIDKQKMKEDSKNVDQSEIDINERAARLVTTLHQDMHNRIGSWFRNEGIKTIDAMSDGPGDLANGLASAFSAGITGVIGGAFPEVAAAMAALAAIEGGVQSGYSSGKKDDAAELKTQAKKFLNDVANEAEALVYTGRDNALKALPALIAALEDNPEDFDRLIQHSNDNIEFLATNRIANRWGTLADPSVLDKMEAKLHRVLVMRIKASAKYEKQMKIQAKLRNNRMTDDEAQREMQDWEAEYDGDHGTMPELHEIDMTRPDTPPRRR